MGSKVKKKVKKTAKQKAVAAKVEAARNEVLVNSLSKVSNAAKVAKKPGNTSAHPIDSATAQWGVGIPLAGQACPDNVTWNDGITIRDTKGADRAVFETTETPQQDEFMWVRVKVVHGQEENYSAPRWVLRGNPKPGSIQSITSEGTNVRVTVAQTSEVPDAKLEVMRKPVGKEKENVFVGTVEHGETSVDLTDQDTSKTLVYGVRAVVPDAGTFDSQRHGKLYGATVFSDDGLLMRKPTCAVASTDVPGTVKVTWGWDTGSSRYPTCDHAIVSWSDYKYAWDSSTAPNTSEVSSISTPALYVPELEAGKRWYFRVQLAMADGTVSPHSDVESLMVYAQPDKPVIDIDDTVLEPGETALVTWAYQSGDGTPQAAAELVEAVPGGYGVIDQTDDDGQVACIDPEALGWSVGTEHSVCLRTRSGSGAWSEYSDVVGVSYVAALACEVTSDGLTEVTDGDGVARRVLTALPLTTAATGAGEGGTTTVTVTRLSDYTVDRPDGTSEPRYAGEVVAQVTGSGEAAVQVTAGDLVGELNDGAGYVLTVTATDSIGRVASADPVEFWVAWFPQAVTPTATVDAATYSAYGAVAITPVAGAGTAETDVADIYRTTIDGNELIYEGASWGETYVDPYPAFESVGAGHLVVCRTADGDVTDGDSFAWVVLDADDGDAVPASGIVIDFGDSRVVLPWNVTLSNRWDKDFERTAYLGGSVVGDWNPAITRDLDAGTAVVRYESDEEQAAMRALAVYAGVCHVRTPDGSSFSANVQVQEERDVTSDAITFSLDIQKVDPQGYAALTLADWQARIAAVTP